MLPIFQIVPTCCSKFLFKQWENLAHFCSMKGKCCPFLFNNFRKNATLFPATSWIDDIGESATNLFSHKFCGTSALEHCFGGVVFIFCFVFLPCVASDLALRYVSDPLGLVVKPQCTRSMVPLGWVVKPR